MKFTPIYGRGTCCFLWCQILALDLALKDPNHWFKVAIMGYQICCWKWLVEWVILGQYHSRCGINQPKRITLACSQVLGRCFRASFVKFGGEMKH